MPSRETKAWRHRTQDRKVLQAFREIKRNRKPKRERTQSWTMSGAVDWDDAEYVPSERVLPRGEVERRREMWAAALTKLEQDAQGESASVPARAGAGLAGRVLEVSTGLCRVEVQGNDVLCRLRGSLGAHESGFTNVVAVGDEVLVSLDGPAEGVVESVLPRRTALVRPDVFRPHLQQVIVANADQLLVVASWREPALWPELVDRYLIAAERHGLLPLICLNKVDLAIDLGRCRDSMKAYVVLGYRVLFTSAVTGEGVGHLRETLRGKVTVLAGLSGVGKSSLLAAVQPGLQLKTAEVSARRHEGRHTTTQVSLIRLGAEGYVVDTPGIREFGLGGLCRAELSSYYPEMLAERGLCAFADCSHTHEPGCAVRQAVRQGRISKQRYDSYWKIYSELPA